MNKFLLIKYFIVFYVQIIGTVTGWAKLCNKMIYEQSYALCIRCYDESTIKT
jgi:hypothetical protein